MPTVPIIRFGAVVAEALVDDCDYDWAMQYKWGLSSSGRYAIRTQTFPDGTQRTMNMHREIIGLPLDDPRETDHVNRNGLDNRRANLRVATKAENLQNQSLFYPGRSKFRGVDFKIQNGKGKWRARLTLEGRQHHVGYFDSEKEAAAAVSAARRRLMPFSVVDQERVA